MKATTHFDIIIEVHFTNKEIKLITEILMHSEYKFEVINIHGFWCTYTRVRELLRNGKREHFKQLTFRQLDQILKASEPYTNGWLKNELALKIAKDIKQILLSVNALAELSNKPVKINFK